MTGVVDIVVTVDDHHAGQLATVAERLRAAGMVVDETLDAIGTITGSVDEAQMAGLSDVAGVEAVEPQRIYRLPPPDSPVQ